LSSVFSPTDMSTSTENIGLIIQTISQTILPNLKTTLETMKKRKSGQISDWVNSIQKPLNELGEACTPFHNYRANPLATGLDFVRFSQSLKHITGPLVTFMENIWNVYQDITTSSQLSDYDRMLLNAYNMMRQCADFLATEKRNRLLEKSSSPSR